MPNLSLDILSKIAEKRISEAIDKGEMDNLPGQGQPLALTDDSQVPEELRMAYKVLKNAGFTPPELEIKNQIAQVEDLLDNAPDEQTRYTAMKRLNYLTLKLGALRPQSALLEDNKYTDRVVERLSRPPAKKPA
ncbi:MAG: DUF1992 domain-containing protein [Deltaproteobacteria bacterium]|nr:DUF1992 domain-containing protein [Deltaproteobacteria bacterium]